MMLAQLSEQAAAGAAKVSEQLAGIPIPSRTELVNQAASLAPLYAALLLVAGIVYLFWGFKIVRALVVLNAALIGAGAGLVLGAMSAWPLMPLVLAAAGAILLGLLAWPLLKILTAVMAALAGAVAGYAICQSLAAITGNPQFTFFAWVGLAGGFVLLGVLAFVLFRPAVMFFTAVQGGLMLTTGIVSLLLSQGNMTESFRQQLTGNDFILPGLIATLAAAGFLIQLMRPTGEEKKPAAEKEPG